MKRNVVIILLMFVVSQTLFAGDRAEKNFGIQLSSDSNFQVVFRGGKVEAGAGVQASLGDGLYANQGLLKISGYAAYRLKAAGSPFCFTLGIKGGTAVGLEELEYEEYIDLSARIGFNYNLSSRFRVSGILYPLSISTREASDVEDSWLLQVTIPKTAAAVTFFF